MPQDPVQPQLSATILLVRDRPEFQVLMVKRHHQIDFASGALVFPGGKVDPGDRDPRWADRARGWTPEPASVVKLAALREAFEESGLLLACPGEGAGFVPGPEATREAALKDGFHAFVARLGTRLDLDALEVFARWITPSLMPRRFDTWFFIAAAPEDQLAACDGLETVDAEWIAPAGALRLARLGERKIIFPTRMNLQLLAESSSVEEAMAAARARPLVTVEPRVEMRDGERVLVLPEDAGYGRVAELLSEAT